VGEPLAASDGEYHDGKRQDRWHNLALYRTAAGGCVVAFQCRSRLPDETAFDQAREVPGLVWARRILRAYDPVDVVQGHPETRKRHERILADVRRRYRAQANALLAQVPEAAGQQVFLDGLQD
jgi:hypothetical protein